MNTDTAKVLEEWQKTFRVWWFDANAGKCQPLTISMELYQASCALNDALEREPLEIAIITPLYYEDDEVCGYCNRQSNMKHEAWCRQ